MCFLAILYKAVDDYPVVVGANRDEFLYRPGTPPLEIAPGVWAGADPRAGGTWLGLNEHGVICGVTNRGDEAARIVGARSRGLLCLETLKAASTALARQTIEQEHADFQFNDFNLLVANRDDAFAARSVQGRLQFDLLTPGLHILGNTTLDNLDESKVRRGFEIIDNPSTIERAISIFTTACRDHGAAGDCSDAICVHARQYGTLSSTIIAVHAGDNRLNRYLHAPANPCSSEYQDLWSSLSPLQHLR